MASLASSVKFLLSTTREEVNYLFHFEPIVINTSNFTPSYRIKHLSFVFDEGIMVTYHTICLLLPVLVIIGSCQQY